MIKPDIQAFFDDVTHTVSYVVSDPNSPACAVIDPVLDFDFFSGRTHHQSADNLITYIQDKGFELQWILETHAHADHLSAAPYIKSRLGGNIAIGVYICEVQKAFGRVFNCEKAVQLDGSQFDRLIKDADTLEIGNLTLRALHTPGHTPACMTYVIGDAAFVGDTLFMPDYGTARCDFPGGDARELYRSIQKLFALPGHTRLFMCHDYLPTTRDHYAWETTVEEQKKNNIHVHQGIGQDEFAKMREARDATLDVPKLIIPSVQVNIRAGELPEAEDNGIQYIKVPINTL